MFAIIFTLISLTEIFTGFQWGYRVIDVIALSCWWIYYRHTKLDPLKPVKLLEPEEPVEPEDLVEPVELDEINP